MSSAVDIQNLEVSFPKKKVLNRACLSIEKGSFSALIGANGAGKSMLIKSVCGLQKFSGIIKIFGRDLKDINKNIIGYVPQNNVSWKNSPISVFQAVSVGRFAKNGIFKKFDETDRKIVNNSLRIAQIEHIADSTLGEISGGESQKVSIARVLAQQPEIIFLDEPQASLDPGSQKIFLNFIEKLYLGFNFTCLIVTHDIDMIPQCCEKVFMLKDGKIVLSTDNKNIKEKVREYDVYG
ncbi:MAG: ABC transporter ATP-binding protein [Endomicrobium sp.]|jgi:ABC-type Mn2+/Zn2+ transport system ATPase subunit|nr:ABC transporter ATP-binding protein [Endomicrobium sp.]